VAAATNSSARFLTWLGSNLAAPGRASGSKFLGRLRPRGRGRPTLRLWSRRGQYYDASAEWERYPTLDQILVGQAPGRTEAGQVTFFMNAGVGFQFAAVGAKALEGARQAGLGLELPDDLFMQTWHT
jgi:hypothetical protein